MKSKREVGIIALVLTPPSTAAKVVSHVRDVTKVRKIMDFCPVPCADRSVPPEGYASIVTIMHVTSCPGTSIMILQRGAGVTPLAVGQGVRAMERVIHMCTCLTAWSRWHGA